ncbi:hypothetical protein RR48_01338 [Papilio machaon]|uniref:Uncharacterized protein n=1 Tax=Papilio machaon TaxID=76193 RepID=A0A0N0PD49_PAPMA|nr:hypothetical protein RR48_01338 [Papilio machaon]
MATRLAIRYVPSPEMAKSELRRFVWPRQIDVFAYPFWLQDRVNPEKMTQAIKKRWQVEPGDIKYDYYSRFVTTVANSDLFHLDGYQEFVNDVKLNVDLYQLAIDVLPEQQVKTTWSREITAKWTPVMTEAGVCYVINSVATADVAM